MEPRPRNLKQRARQRKYATGETETDLCPHYSPIDGRAGDKRAEDCGYKGVVELGEEPARLLHAPLEESFGA